MSENDTDDAAYGKAYRDLAWDVVDLGRSAKVVVYLAVDPPPNDGPELLMHAVNQLSDQIAQFKKKYTMASRAKRCSHERSGRQNCVGRHIRANVCGLKQKH
jgi:hypothetical protein